MKRKTIALLLALYFVQGLPFGFQAVALPVYLRQQGASLAEIGLVGVLAAPWMLKMLWAPLVDRYHWPRLGRRRSWILPAQAGLALSCAAAAAVGGTNLTLLLGLGNAAQVVGFKFGMLTGGGLLVWMSQWIGWWTRASRRHRSACGWAPGAWCSRWRARWPGASSRAGCRC